MSSDRRLLREESPSNPEPMKDIQEMVSGSDEVDERWEEEDRRRKMAYRRPTSLVNSIPASRDELCRMQLLANYASRICALLQELQKERARAIVERRAADNDDKMAEIEQAIVAARVELQKGSSAKKVAAAIAASRVASANTRAVKGAPGDLDEFDGDANLKKQIGISRRLEAQKQRKKVQPLVGKTLERMQVTGGMESGTGRLAIHLQKMLMEMNQYDHTRSLSRTFNLKEAL